MSSIREQQQPPTQRYSQPQVSSHDHVESFYGSGKATISSVASIKRPKTPERGSPPRIKVENPPPHSIGKQELLVPKTEQESRSCRSTPPPHQHSRHGYDSYLNQDSNSSSVSSMETMATRGLPLQQAPPPPPGYASHEAQRSPYDHPPPPADDTYVRSYAQMNELGSLARPVVSYSSDMSSRGYESHRPYESGAGAFDRYEPSSGSGSAGGAGACGLQQRAPYPYMTPLDDSERYQDHSLPSAPLLKPDHTEPEQSTGPIYPRYINWIFHNKTLKWRFESTEFFNF